MELSRDEVYKNKKVSAGVTILSFIVMLGFFIFTKFVSDNPPSNTISLAQVELGMAPSSPENNSGNTKMMSASALVNKENSSSNSILKGNEAVVLENEANTISQNYKNASFRSGAVSGTDSIIAPSDFQKTGRAGVQGLSEGNSPFGFYLPERSVITKPSFSNSAMEQGKVVVEVIVDKNGNVLEANPNGRGTNTSSSALKNEAKRMALATVFNADQKSEEQRGTITIIFSYN